MTSIGERALELARDKTAISLRWLLEQKMDESGHEYLGALLDAGAEIDAALISSGWTRFRDPDYKIFYRRRPGRSAERNDQKQPATQTAPEILAAAAECISQRAATRDLPAERSMARTVRAFNALTGHTLSERDGWLFMVALKAARATAGAHNPDDYIDGTAYFALAGEGATGNHDD